MKDKWMGAAGSLLASDEGRLAVGAVADDPGRVVGSMMVERAEQHPILEIGHPAQNPGHDVRDFARWMDDGWIERIRTARSRPAKRPNAGVPRVPSAAQAAAISCGQHVA